MGQAKGSNMHHMKRFVLEREGEDVWDRVLDSMPNEDREVLRGLLPVGWYDLALQHRLLRAIDATLGSGDLSLVDAIGGFEADRDLKVVHRLFLRMASPAFVLEKAGDYWSRFYDTGKWEVERFEPRAARGTLRGVEPFDPAFGRYLAAYILRMWALVGGKLHEHRWEVRQDEGQWVFMVEGRWR